MTNIAQSSRAASTRQHAAFTLVELLVSTAVLSVLMLVSLSALETVQRSWRGTKTKVNQFREARIAFESITRNLSQATLNPYWDYYYAETQSNTPPSSGSARPTAYVRHSELDFCAIPAAELTDGRPPEHYPGHALFFQAPLGHSQTYRGQPDLLNARGYYVLFKNNEDQRPPFLPQTLIPLKHSYQLMEYRPPAERTAAHPTSSAGNTVYTDPEWYRNDLAANSRPIADNILLLLISPLASEEATPSTSPRHPWWLAPTYRYRSRDVNNTTPELDLPGVRADGSVDQGTQHLLPPLVRVTLVAGDETDIKRWLGPEEFAVRDLRVEADAPFDEASNYERDLDRLKRYLNSQKINYRVFATTVTLRNAAWDSNTF